MLFPLRFVCVCVFVVVVGLEDLYDKNQSWDYRGHPTFSAMTFPLDVCGLTAPTGLGETPRG